MLSDLLSLESMFGRKGATLFLDEAITRYGEQNIKNALNQGHLENRTVYLGPDSGRTLCWLSEEGRCAAARTGDF